MPKRVAEAPEFLYDVAQFVDGGELMLECREPDVTWGLYRNASILSQTKLASGSSMAASNNNRFASAV